MDCRSCTETQKIDRGCVEDSPIPERWEIEDYRFQRCPLTFFTEAFADYMTAYKLFKLGYLPNPGCWRQQPKKFTEAMLIIDDQIKLKEIENARRK